MRLRTIASLTGAALAMASAFFSCSPETAENTQQNSQPVVEKGDPKLEQGKALFNDNCASCHHPLRDVTGPALQGALARWGGDTAKIHAFVHNSQKVVKSDAYAKALYEKFDETIMTPFPQLSGEDIDAILYYVDRYKTE